MSSTTGAMTMPEDAPAIDGALLDAAESILDGRDREHAITAGELSDRLGLDDGEASPQTRELVRACLTERRLPVRSGNVGYWVCQSEQEASEYLDTLRGRIAGIEDRMAAFETAWEHHGLVADGGNVDSDDAVDDAEPAVPDEVREQLEDDPVLTVQDWLDAYGDDAEVVGDA
jgi:hypothetical protein